MKKYNHKTKEFENYNVPSNWKCVYFNYNKGKTPINCASCGVMLDYWLSYTSKEILSDYGSGYAVCKDCHDKESY